MAEATIRDLRNHGGEVIDRVAAGEHIVVTRGGQPVAELRPVPRRRPTATVLVEQFRRLAPVDPERLRRDIDQHIDPSL